MKQIETDPANLPMLTLYVLAKRAFSMSKEVGVSKAARGYTINEHGITGLYPGQSAADKRFQLFPKTCWLDQAETIMTRAAWRRLIGTLKENGMGCCLLPFGELGWCFELNLDVSSLGTPAVYCVKVGSAHQGARPWENDVVIDVTLFTGRVDAEVVEHVKMVDGILCDLLDECMEQAWW